MLKHVEIQERNPKTYNDEETPLHTAAKKGQNEVFKLLFHSVLVEDRNPSNTFGWTPLHFAAGKGNFEIVEFLMNNLEDKFPKNNYGWTPLHYASKEGHYKIVKIMLDNGADIKQFVHLWLVAANGHLEVLKLLIKQASV